MKTAGSNFESGGAHPASGSGRVKPSPLFHAPIAFWLSVFFITGGLSACKYLKKSTSTGNEKPLARVENEYLYLSDIEPVLKSIGNTKDSATIVQSYLEDWVKRKLMVRKALLYLPDDKLNIDKQVSDYRESLILYIYEKELILQKLDTIVDETTLLNYFTEYKTNFELESNVVQMKFIKTPVDAPMTDSLTRWLASGGEEHLLKLENYCHQYASKFSLSDSVWFDFPSVFTNIPVSQQVLDAAIRHKSPHLISDSLFNYVIKVNDFRPKGEIAPFEFVKSDIARIILNKRKKELVRSTYENVYLEGKRSNTAEIYK